MLQVAHERAVPLPTFVGPIIDPDHRGNLGGASSPAPDGPQQRIIADRQHEPVGEARGGATTENQAKVVDDALEPRGASRVDGRDCRVKPLGEDPHAAGTHAAAEPAHDQANHDTPTSGRQVRQAPYVAAMKAAGDLAARGT